MPAHRAKILGATIGAAGAASLLLAGAPATAQVDQNTAVNILRECARIDDPSARLACYDNNIRNVGGVARTTVPGTVQVQGGAAPVAPNSPQSFGLRTPDASSPPAQAAANGPQGFGAEDVRTPERFSTPAGQLQEINARITSIRPREPGIYAFTLEDGAEWLFAEGVSSGYRVPRNGSTVEIERGGLGSFLMRFDNQGPVPVRRVR
jgi:hypothetical protein